MTFKLFRLVLVTAIVFTSCSRDENENQTVKVNALQKEPLTPTQINATINQVLSSNKQFHWSEMSSQMIWSAALQGQNLITVGFGNSETDYDRSKSYNNQKMQDDLLQLISKHEGKEIKDILVSSDAFLNLMDVVITKQETVLALRQTKFVRYVEPADYRFLGETPKNQNEKSSSSTSSGCGLEASTLNSADFTTVTPNARVPWAFYQHNIPSAWNVSTGRGITIGVIDTGTSPNQTLLGSSFNNGLSTGRTIQKFGTFVDSIWPWSTATDGSSDLCGHGTSMSSVATAPRNDKGLPVGVAYNANLVTYRAAENVLLEGYHEQNGVKDAFTGLGNNPNVKIISMSMGYIFSVGKISDAVKYAHSRGKLIFCAGGTSTTFTTFVGVIFPAWMPEAVAVTGVKEGTTYQKCDVCHTGDKIDFTIAMQRATGGNTVPVTSYYENQSDYVGGSSVATATTAGIAALVWAKNPTWTRDQVLTKMKQSARYYPTKNPDFGHGNIDALKAVQ